MPDKLEPLSRCCARHADWQQLADHLCRDFPTVTSEQVGRNVLDAQSITERFGLDSADALDIGELIARYQLMVSTGEIPDVARTDPQTHQAAGAATALDAPPQANGAGSLHV